MATQAQSTRPAGRAGAAADVLAAAWDGLLDWFYPRHCYACGACLHGSRARMLCGACALDLAACRIAGAVCPTCGLPLSGQPAPGALCISCRAQRRHFDTARAFVSYAGPVRALVHAFKFQGECLLGPRLLETMWDRGWLPDGVGEADCIVPVPLHPRRRRERGYDQALILARVVARRLGARLLSGALARTRYTSQQSLLPVGKRWDNVRGAFAVARGTHLAGRSVLLVDDVMTTGVTADECARALSRASVARVHVLTLARALP